MSEKVICLSDSDESFELLTSVEPPNPNNDRGDSRDETDFDFPPVEFTYRVNDPPISRDDRSSDKANEERVHDVDDLEYAPTNHYNGSENKNCTNEKNEKRRDENPILQRRNVEKEETTVDQRRTEVESSTKTRQQSNDAITRSNVQTRVKPISEEKSLKALRKRNAESIRPGLCLKSMQVCLDNNLEKFEFHTGIIDALTNFDISWKWQDLIVPNSIAWTRKVEEEYRTDDGKVSSRMRISKENHRLIVWNNDEIVRRIREGSFVSAIEESIDFEGNSIRSTLILYRIEEYFRGFKEARAKSNVARKTLEISGRQLELALADIQINLNCASRSTNTPQELGHLVYEFTKSIAEIPYKLDKRNKLEEKLDWYSTGDNTDTVKVDRSGIGLKRLWRQQLCQFNLASLETAEAISGIYPSPRDLIKTYEQRSSDEGEGLLKDVPIRRAAGPLSTVRTIGPVLSKTVYTMFTSITGDTTLGNEK